MSFRLIRRSIRGGCQEIARNGSRSPSRLSGEDDRREAACSRISSSSWSTSCRDVFPDGPASFLHAPNLARLAERSVRFNANYCASPLCAPSRAAFMSGQLPSRTGVYDNAAEFPSSMPTFAHHLRRLGYRTALSGKMHFVGPDQLHGFEERLTTDIYPGRFRLDARLDEARRAHRLVVPQSRRRSPQAGVAEMTNQLEYDDEVAHFARQRIFDFARQGDGRPFCLTVSFTHPHDPYVMRQKYWDLYRDADIPMPGAAIPYEEQDPHSRRILDFVRLAALPHRRRATSAAARRAYFAVDLLSRRNDRRAARRRSRHAASPRTRSSSSPPTTATCSASVASGSR